MAAAKPQTGQTSPPGFIYRFGRFELDTRSGDLHRNGYRVRLQEQPRSILIALLERAGDLVRREELQQILWPVDTFVDFDIGLNAAIRKLRMALGDRVKSPQFIETVARRGYRFMAPVAMFEIDAAQPPSRLFPAGDWLTALEAVKSLTPSALSLNR